MKCSKCEGNGPFPDTGRQCKKCLAAHKAAWYQKNRVDRRIKDFAYQQRPDYKRSHAEKAKNKGQSMPLEYWVKYRQRKKNREDMGRSKVPAEVIILEKRPDWLRKSGEIPFQYNPDTDVLEGKYRGEAVSLSTSRYRKVCKEALFYCSDRAAYLWIYALSFPSYWSRENSEIRDALKGAVAEGKMIDIQF